MSCLRISVTWCTLVSTALASFPVGVSNAVLVACAVQNKNQYDTDVITWSPQGRLYQVEYAMEAVKQGSASVGLVSDTFAILASLRRWVPPLYWCHWQQAAKGFLSPF